MTRLTRGTLGVTLLACVTLASCSSYQVTPADVIVPNSRVRVQFSEPTDLVLLTADGASLPMSNVTDLAGRLVSRGGDSITIMASEARHGVGFASSSSRFTSSISLLLYLGDDTRLLTRQRQEKTTLAALFAALAIPVSFLVLLAELDCVPICP